MKVTVIGGGSSYTPELINGFLQRFDSFPLSELWLMDILPERLDIVGKFAQRIVEAHGAPFKVILTTDQQEAVKGANYVTTQLRVGWMQARRLGVGDALQDRARWHHAPTGRSFAPGLFWFAERDKDGRRHLYLAL